MLTFQEATIQLVDTVPTADRKKDRTIELKGLDFLRFVLALNVTVFHYVHFFTFFSCKDMQQCFPSYTYLHVMYAHGSHHVVSTFWLVSGIVFMKVYNERISNGEITLKDYALNRMSRLYPLHFVTLLLVAILQNSFHHIYKRYFTYTNNTCQTFIENLLFIQSWRSSFTFSFNGPSWSVSTEILIYFMFFLLSFNQLFKNLPMTIAVWILSLYTAKMNLIFANSLTNRCCEFFLTGCLAMKLVDTFKKKVFKISFITLLFILSKLDTTKSLSNFVDSADDLVLGTLSAVLFIYLFNLGIINKIPFRSLSFLGNITYAMYLLHFPVQLMIMLIINPQDLHIFSETWMLLIYVSTVIVLSILCYRYFEQPMQSYIRKKDRERFVHKSVLF